MARRQNNKGKAVSQFVSGRKKLKALLVGDHRDSLNWGGRGQSIALHQLLRKRFEISGVIPGISVVSPEAVDGYVRTILPQTYFRFLVRARNKVKVADWYLKVEELFGAKDFITDEPTESAEYVLRYKSTSKGLAEIYDLVINADAVVINGEGSGIFRTPYRRDFFFYLMMIELAVRLGKAAFYVNGIISDCPFTGRNSKNFDSARMTLKKCAAVLVRDQKSLEYVAREMPEVKCHYIPDALFTWYPLYEGSALNLPANGDFVIAPPEQDEYFGKLDFSRPYICMGGSSWAAEYQEKSVDSYLLLFEGLRKLGYPVYITENCGGDRFLKEVAKRSGAGLVPLNTPILTAGAILANARLFVSGRFHPTILATLGGTPCIFLEAHSHKMASLRETIGYEGRKPFSALPNENEIGEILDLAQRYLEQGNTLRDRLRQRAMILCEEASQLVDYIVLRAETACKA